MIKEHGGWKMISKRTSKFKDRTQVKVSQKSYKQRNNLLKIMKKEERVKIDLRQIKIINTF